MVSGSPGINASLPPIWYRPTCLAHQLILHHALFANSKIMLMILISCLGLIKNISLSMRCNANENQLTLVTKNSGHEMKVKHAGARKIIESNLLCKRRRLLHSCAVSKDTNPRSHQLWLSASGQPDTNDQPL